MPIERVGVIGAANLTKGNHQKPNYLGIPSVVFTVPPLAAVGLSESGARERNLKFSVKKEMTSTWYASRRVAETYSAAQHAFPRCRLSKSYWKRGSDQDGECGPMTKQNFSGASSDVRAELLEFFGHPDAPYATKRKPKDWAKVQAELEQLKKAAPAVVTEETE
jgi:hypothetical protein